MDHLNLGKHRPPQSEADARGDHKREDGIVAHLLAPDLLHERVDPRERVPERVDLAVRRRESCALVLQRVLGLQSLAVSATPRHTQHVSLGMSCDIAAKKEKTSADAIMLLVMERDESTARRSFNSESTSASCASPSCCLAFDQLHRQTRNRIDIDPNTTRTLPVAEQLLRIALLLQCALVYEMKASKGCQYSHRFHPLDVQRTEERRNSVLKSKYSSRYRCSNASCVLTDDVLTNELISSIVSDSYIRLHALPMPPSTHRPKCMPPYRRQRVFNVERQLALVRALLRRVLCAEPHPSNESVGRAVKSLHVLPLTLVEDLGAARRRPADRRVRRDLVLQVALGGPRVAPQLVPRVRRLQHHGGRSKHVKNAAAEFPK